jgi:large subunit ribosomal protein LP0
MPLSKEKKSEYHTRLMGMFGTYTKCFVVAVDNVGSQQMNLTRKSMRGKAEILMGKNTMIKKVLRDFLVKNPDHFFQHLEPKIQGNVGFVFTNNDLSAIRDLIVANKVPAPARVGAVSPVDVVVPAGPTGCDPGQTNFFQVLQIPTKIVKGQIEITAPVNLIKKGDKVEASQAALLQKLNIRPFSYGLSIDVVFDAGSIFTVDILDIDANTLQSRFSTALRQVAALALEVGHVCQASLPHLVGNAFRTLVAVTVGLDGYSFPKADPYKAFLANPSAFASAAPAAASSGAAPAAAAVVEKPKVEEVDALDGGMDMFGGSGGAKDY